MKNWNIEEMTGYKPITTFWQDFTIAEKFGIKAVKETFDKVFEEWHKDYKYLTELVMVLNWKIFEHFQNDRELAKVYNDLWEQADNYAWENLKDEELSYFYNITD